MRRHLSLPFCLYTLHDCIHSGSENEYYLEVIVKTSCDLLHKNLMHTYLKDIEDSYLL